MSATKKSGVISGLELGVGKKCIDAASAIFSGKRREDESGLKGLDQALDSFLSELHFEISVLRPKTFGQFLELEKPTQSIFNQLASEVKWWELLDQIEETCFLNPSMIEKAKPFIEGLWQEEVAKNPFQPPTNWRYASPEDAVSGYRAIFNKDLRAGKTLELAKQMKSCQGSEGIAVWPKLTALAKIFNVSGNPLEDTEEGREAYAKIVELLIPIVGKAYTKVYPNYSFKNWREKALTADHLRLTPAGRKTWQGLEEITDDDFVIAPASSGSLYAGHSVRCARIKITLASNQLSQDCIMAGAPIAIQPNRFTKFEDLGIDCPGNQCSPAADGKFSQCLYFHWHDGKLYFDSYWAVYDSQHFGSACCLG